MSGMMPSLVWALAGSLGNTRHNPCACLPASRSCTSLIALSENHHAAVTASTPSHQVPGLLLGRGCFADRLPCRAGSLSCRHKTCYQNGCLLFLRRNLATANFLHFLQSLIHSSSLCGIGLFFTLLYYRESILPGLQRNSGSP